MSWLRGWRLLATLGVVAIALTGVLLVLVVSSDDDGSSDHRQLTAEAAPDTTSSSSTSTTLAPSSSSSTRVPTTTTSASVRPASPGPTTSLTTSTTAPASTTTSTSAPPHTPAECPDPGPSSDFADFDADVVVIENDRGLHQSCMLIADTPERRRRGLMGQDDLDGYAGMAFLFDDERERSFWMRNTRIPLSIAFFDAEGAFVSSKDMEPCDDGADCPTYSSDGPAQFAIEVPQGRLASVGATPGSKFEPDRHA